MTVSSSTAKAGPYAGAGSAGPFTVPFRFLAASHLKVIRTSATGIDATLTLTTDYTVSGVGAASGSITLTTALAAGEKLTIVRNVPFLQLADYVNNDAFPAESHEDALDLLTMQSQQLKERIDSSLTLPPSAFSVDTTLPAPQPNKFIGWNEAGNALQNLDGSTLATIVAFGTSRADVFVGTGAQTQFSLTANPGTLANLDVAIGGVTQIPGVDYTFSGTTLSFITGAPALGVRILARYFQALPQGTTDSAASTFLQLGAGAVSTNVQAKLREIFSFEDRGAVGDGSSDDTSRVQAAIDYVASIGGGDVVGMPGKTYRITSALQLRNRVRINLRTSTVLQATDNTPIFKAPSTGDIQSWGLENGRLRFNNQQTSAQTSAIGVQLADTKLSYDWYVQDLRVERACDGITCPSSAGSFAFVGRLVNVIADTCARWAMNLDCDSAAGANTNIEIKNCWALQPSGAAISTSRGFRINALSQANIQSLFSDYIAVGTLLSATNVDGYFGILTLEATTLSVSSGAVALVELSECSGTIESLKLVSNSLTTTGSGEIYMLRVATSGTQSVTVNNFVTQTNTYSGTGIYEVNPAAGSTVRVRRARLDRTANLVDPTASAPRIVEWDGRPRIGLGTTAQRPSLTANARGVVYLDTTLNANGLPIFWNGSNWVNFNGTIV